MRQKLHRLHLVEPVEHVEPNSRVLPTNLAGHQLPDFPNTVLRILLEKGSIQRNQGPPIP